MKLEDVNEELLRKFAENTCTEDERNLVEQWLNNNSFEETKVPFSFEAEKSQIKKEIWDSLLFERQNKKKNKHLSTAYILRYSASAAVILILITFGFLSKTVIENKPEKSMQIVQVCNEPTFIPVDNNTDILFISETEGQNKLSQKISCVEGNTYLAIKVKFESVEELLVINEKDIQSLPPYLNSYIANQIKG